MVFSANIRCIFKLLILIISQSSVIPAGFKPEFSFTGYEFQLKVCRNEKSVKAVMGTDILGNKKPSLCSQIGQRLGFLEETFYLES